MDATVESTLLFIADTSNGHVKETVLLYDLFVRVFALNLDTFNRLINNINLFKNIRPTCTKDFIDKEYLKLIR